MIRILHTADLHLGAVFAELGEQAAARRADQLETFARIIDLALAQQVHLLLVAGDLFASPCPPADAVDAVRTGFRRLRQNGIRPVVLPGAADACRCSGEVYGRDFFNGALLLPAAREGERLALDIAGRLVYLHAVRVEDGRMVPAADFADAGIHVGVLHLGAEAACPDGVALESCLASWPGDYLALGGPHAYGECHRDGRLIGCHPGSPEGLDFDETGARCCVLVTVGEGPPVLEKHTVNRRTLEARQLDVSDARDIEQIAAQIRDFGHPDCMLRLVLTGRPDLLIDAARLQAAVAADFHYLAIEDKTPLLGSALVKDLAGTHGCYGVLARKALALASGLPGEERPVLEAALREILLRRRGRDGVLP